MLVNGSYAKPSREVKPGDAITVKKMPVTYSFRVVELVSSRQPAKEVPRYAENVTPQEELDKLNIPKLSIFVQRDRGSGRPTKRERREIGLADGRSSIPKTRTSSSESLRDRIPRRHDPFQMPVPRKRIGHRRLRRYGYESPKRRRRFPSWEAPSVSNSTDLPSESLSEQAIHQHQIGVLAYHLSDEKLLVGKLLGSPSAFFVLIVHRQLF